MFGTLVTILILVGSFVVLLVGQTSAALAAGIASILVAATNLVGLFISNRQKRELSKPTTPQLNAPEKQDTDN